MDGHNEIHKDEEMMEVREIAFNFGEMSNLVSNIEDGSEVFHSDNLDYDVDLNDPIDYQDFVRRMNDIIKKHEEKQLNGPRITFSLGGARDVVLIENQCDSSKEFERMTRTLAKSADRTQWGTDMRDFCAKYVNDKLMNGEKFGFSVLYEQLTNEMLATLPKNLGDNVKADAHCFVEMCTKPVQMVPGYMVELFTLTYNPGKYGNNDSVMKLNNTPEEPILNLYQNNLSFARAFGSKELDMPISDFIELFLRNGAPYGLVEKVSCGLRFAVLSWTSKERAEELIFWLNAEERIVENLLIKS